MLAAPCCHHDVATQLRNRPAPGPYDLLTRQGILRERFADVLTDALRAGLLRLHGYRAEVVEFVDSAHTPRNLLIRARQVSRGLPMLESVLEEIELELMEGEEALGALGKAQRAMVVLQGAVILGTLLMFAVGLVLLLSYL